MNRRQPINLCISESREGRERERERGGGECVCYILCLNSFRLIK